MTPAPFDPLDDFLFTGQALHIAPDGKVRSDAPLPPVLLSGSFNPLHEAHLELARVAAEMLGQPVAFELSVANVDKPTLGIEEVRRRVVQFRRLASVWLTQAPRFLDKAEQFPGATFVVGADTALRLVSPRYHDGSEARLREVLAQLRRRGCRFLVACRADGDGPCLTLDDLAIPPGARDLFQAIPTERFRMDLSSTQLRTSPRR